MRCEVDVRRIEQVEEVTPGRRWNAGHWKRRWLCHLSRNAGRGAGVGHVGRDGVAEVVVAGSESEYCLRPVECGQLGMGPSGLDGGAEVMVKLTDWRAGILGMPLAEQSFGDVGEQGEVWFRLDLRRLDGWWLRWDGVWWRGKDWDWIAKVEPLEDLGTSGVGVVVGTAVDEGLEMGDCGIGAETEVRR